MSMSPEVNAATRVGAPRTKTNSASMPFFLKNPNSCAAQSGATRGLIDAYATTTFVGAVAASTTILCVKTIKTTKSTTRRFSMGFLSFRNGDVRRTDLLCRRESHGRQEAGGPKVRRNYN